MCGKHSDAPMSATLLRAAAILCCGILGSCSVSIPIQDPNTLAPDSINIISGAELNRLFGYEVSRGGQDFARTHEDLMA